MIQIYIQISNSVANVIKYTYINRSELRIQEKLDNKSVNTSPNVPFYAVYPRTTVN